MKTKYVVNTDGSLYGYRFYCPGCKMNHVITTAWGFNGDHEKPTFTPSILRRGTVFPTDEETERILKGEEFEPVELVCHSFITDGKIQYLGDCTHDMKDQTVDLSPL